MSDVLKGKKIILGVCGGIAAYKSIELLRLLQKEGADIRVVMTPSALEFATELTFRVLSGHRVYHRVFDDEPEGSITHIKWAEEADAVVIAPATANSIAKFATGMADDALSTLMLAVKAPVVICPSMNTFMYENRAVQRNLDRLEADGFSIIEPGSGELACGVTGAGRLPSPGFIVDRVKSRLTKKDLAGKKILITAGPTREAIDPVRFITNHSSGKMGYAIARAAEYRGAHVTLISGPVNINAPEGVSLVKVETADEMAKEVFSRMIDVHILVKVAAVADYKPDSTALHKIKKNEGDLTIAFKKNQDILKEAGKRKTDQFLVGFAAETRDLDENAGAKLLKKNLDMIVGNIVGRPESGFGADTNIVTFFHKDGTKEPLSLMEKNSLADVLLDRIIEKNVV